MKASDLSDSELALVIHLVSNHRERIRSIANLGAPDEVAECDALLEKLRETQSFARRTT
jgi:hypothetical protein